MSTLVVRNIETHTKEGWSELLADSNIDLKWTIDEVFWAHEGHRAEIVFNPDDVKLVITAQYNIWSFVFEDEDEILTLECGSFDFNSVEVF